MPLKMKCSGGQQAMSWFSTVCQVDTLLHLSPRRLLPSFLCNNQRATCWVWSIDIFWLLRGDIDMFWLLWGDIITWRLANQWQRLESMLSKHPLHWCIIRGNRVQYLVYWALSQPLIKLAIEKHHHMPSSATISIQARWTYQYQHQLLKLTCSGRHHDILNINT
jgi:hypothetical protein